MCEEEDVIREMYISDTILAKKEMEMMMNLDDTYFDLMEELHQRIEQHQLILMDSEFEHLEDVFNHFYFEYGYIQFKRGLEIGLSMRNIH